MVVLYRTYPRSIRGLREWLWASLAATVTAGLLLGRNVLPDWLSIIVANLTLMLTPVFMYAGLQHYVDETKKISVATLAWVLIPYVAWFAWFTYIDQRVDMRIAAMCVYTIVFSILSLRVLFSRVQNTAGRNVMVAAFSLILATRGYRLLSLAFDMDAGLELFQANAPQMVLLGAAVITIPLITIGSIMLASEKLRERLEYMSRYDELTGCLNKATGVLEAEREIARARRRRQPLSLMIIDIDRFKQINDTAGHLAGDRVLCDFAARVQKVLRQTDQFSRFGGDEFVVVLPDTDLSQAQRAAERIHAAGRERSAEGWSCSIGLTQWGGESESLDALLSRADTALYKAKDLGRNQTQTA